MTDGEVTRVVEAVLFAADAPVTLDRLVEIITEAERGQIRRALDELCARCVNEERSFEVAEVAGGWQLYCRPAYAKWIRELHKGRAAARLSQAALETLAIVAYKQPIVRAEIESVRGVDSTGVLATLLRRNLVTIAGRAPGMGRALMYRTTKEFLRYFGLSTITDLPRLEEFAEVLGLAPGELALTAEAAGSVEGGLRAPDEREHGAPPTPTRMEEVGPPDPDRMPSPASAPRPAVTSAADPGPGDAHALEDREILEASDET